MKEEQCAYCGKSGCKITRDHVIPRCLYPPSKKNSKVQLLKIPACAACNNGWSDDEVHFRNILLIAGQPNSPRFELWEKSALPSFDEADGFRRMDDLISMMIPVNLENGRTGHMVYPGKDKRVLRVVKKVIRGLSYYHKITWPLSEQRIKAYVLTFNFPKILQDQMEYYHRDPDIVEYRFQVLNENNISTIWLITFFQMVTFVGLVSISDSGFDPHEQEG